MCYGFELKRKTKRGEQVYFLFIVLLKENRFNCCTRGMVRVTGKNGIYSGLYGEVSGSQSLLYLPLQYS